MVAALVRLAVLLLLVWLGWRIFKYFRALPQVPADRRTPRPPPHLKVVELKRSPHDVLGVGEDASPDEIRAARDRLLAENDPERVAHMSPDIQATARRVCEEVEDAYEELTRKVH